ncbi:hypothetical protein BH11BAC7_BH11BAC7_08640 [soil metagenome]
MTIEKKARWIAGGLTVLLVLAVSSTLFYYNSGQAYKSDADRARLAQDSILAVKQLLDKEMQDTRIELENSKGRNAELDIKLAESEAALHEKQMQIDKLLAENATVASLRKQLRDLKTERLSMEKQIQSLLAENHQLQEDNLRMSQNIGQLERDNMSLQDKLYAADVLNSRAGNFRVDMMRNSSKVTAKAKRTNEIGVSFELPSTISSATGSKEIYLVVLDPQGKPVANKSNKKITLKDGRTITAVKTQTADLSGTPQTISLNVKLDSKMKQKGIYKVQVFTEDGMLGATQMRMN